jgi:hypothetical protein
MTVNKYVRTLINQAPDAIAIVLGPLGSHPNDRILERYARMYYDRNCSVIITASPPLHFMMNWSLQSTAKDVLQQTMTALKDTPSHVPVIMHSFSNGGSFLLDEIEQQLNVDEHPHSLSNSTAGSQEKQYSIVASRLKYGYQFFDSCPCYIRTIWDTTYFTSSFPSSRLPTFVRYVYTAAASFGLTLWCACTMSLSKPQQFWDRMLRSTCCSNQIFMYTTADVLTDAAAVDRFITTRQKQGVKCSIYRYDDSDHCRLLDDHPTEYNQAIDDALKSILPLSK